MENNDNISGQFSLPDGYFKGSKTSIFNKIEWQNEHETYPTLLGLKGQHGFIVPQHYFDLSEQQLELLAFDQLAQIKKQNPFNVPKHYFVTAKDQMLVKADVVSELRDFDLLQSITKELPLTVSEDHFTLSKQRILIKTLPNSGAKIISLNRKPYWFAAAAILTIVFSLWIYNSYFNQSDVIDGDCNTLACIEKRELLKYKLDNLDNDELYELVNTQKLEERLIKKQNSDSLKTSDSIDTSIIDFIE